MIKMISFLFLNFFFLQVIMSQKIIPLDTIHWNIRAKAYLFENYKGKDAIYLQGAMTLKDTKFLNGIIEYDIYLKEEQSFPGVTFRRRNGDAERFFLRPHLSGKPDANQAIPLTKGITAFQLYFGPRYSFPYAYNYDDWTHVKIVVHGGRAQVFLNYSPMPNLSWYLFHETLEGAISFNAGGSSGAQHLANIQIIKDIHGIKNFSPIKNEPIEDLVPEWEVSDMFEEKLLNDPSKLNALINSRKWQGKIQIEEGRAINISRKIALFDGSPGNTVFVKIMINSDKDQKKLFHFGYSDRVITILNNNLIYKGTNKYRTRDYRYLGTIGLFDGIYLDLKKGRNTLLMAVSEDFGGWLVTGKFEDPSGLKIE